MKNPDEFIERIFFLSVSILLGFGGFVLIMIHNGNGREAIVLALIIGGISAFMFMRLIRILKNQMKILENQNKILEKLG